jgi:hypothetical protein
VVNPVGVKCAISILENDSEYRLIVREDPGANLTIYGFRKKTHLVLALAHSGIREKASPGLFT